MDRPPVTPIILAGGASRRMGSPKATLPFGGESLIERIVSAMSVLGESTIVVAAGHVPLPALPPSVLVVTDEIPLQGPVGGILYGLRESSSDLAFVVSCDQPFPSIGLAKLLIASIGAADVALARWRGTLQPLFAVYHRRIVPRLEAAVRSGDLRLLSFVATLDAVEVGEDEVRRADPEGLSFLDLDTPEAYREAERRLQKPGP